LTSVAFYFCGRRIEQFYTKSQARGNRVLRRVAGQSPVGALIRRHARCGGAVPTPLLVSGRATSTLEYTQTMNVAFDLRNETLSRSLAETIGWCGSQQIITTTEETEDIKHRRSLGEQAGELTHRAFLQRNRLWNRILRREYHDSPLWRRGMELYRQADLSSIAPLGEQLRSPALHPAASIAEIRTNDERAELVREVIQKRSALIHIPEQSTNLSSGKLLLYCPDENLACGAAKYSSRGFFDDDNVPPWDTWVSFSRGTLLSWVPPSLVGMVQAGIDVNPESCILWMDAPSNS
jgi:hypothetical protein